MNGIDENCNGMSDDSCSNVLHVKVFIEGYYLGSDQMKAVVSSQQYPTLCDTINVELHAITSPYQLLFAVRDTIDIFGNGFFLFPTVVQGNEYYVVVKHRNSLETWSKNSVIFTGTHVNYNFTLNINRAYGNNMKDLGDGNFAIFSGDVNQDGLINNTDLDQLSAAIPFFSPGYSINDLTGDYIIESTDMSLVENNIGLAVIRP